MFVGAVCNYGFGEEGKDWVEWRGGRANHNSGWRAGKRRLMEGRLGCWRGR